MDKDPGSGTNRKSYNKKEILYQAMYRNQPSIDDFRGHPGFPNRMLRDDQEYLSNKNIEIFYSEKKSSDDDFARYMEPVITYVLNSEETFPSRNNFSFLASDYDDKRNGADIVFGVEGKKADGFMVFSIDVASGTSVDNIQKKFRTSLDGHDGVSYIKYCKYKEMRWREPNAPHFIIGMSPASQNEAVSKIIVEDGELKGRGVDLDTDFLILSEIREQIRMQLDILKNKPKTDKIEQRIAKLKDLQPAITTGLYRALSIDNNSGTREERLKMFDDKYTLKSAELAKRDDVYSNIVTTSKQRARGGKALSSI